MATHERESDRAPITGSLRVVVFLAGLVIIGAGVKAAADVIGPLLIAFLLAGVIRPVTRWLEERGVPRWVTIPGVLLVTAVVLAAVGVILVQAGQQLQAQLPSYVDRLQTLTASVGRWLHEHRILAADARLDRVLNADRLVGIAGGALSGVLNVTTGTFLVIVLTVFVLLEAHGFAEKVARLWPDAAEELRAMGVAARIQRYLAFRTVLGLITGTLIVLWLLWVGLDLPFLWGLLAFVFDFVPTLGPFLAGVPAVLFALVELDPAHAALVAGGYVVVNVVMGNFVDPNVLGRGLSLSPLVVILSMIVWGWLLGFTGLLLAPILTMALRVTAEHVGGLHWLAVVLGPAPDPGSGA